MPYSVQLRFDDSANAIILELATLIEELGTPNPYTVHAAVPHIALAVSDAMNLDQTVEDLNALKLERFAVSFSSLGSFAGQENVLFLAPQVDPRLLGMHQRVTDSLTSLERPWAYYGPDSWVPHCTIGINISESLLGESFASVQKAFRPFSAEVVSISVTKFRPNVTLHTKELP